MKKNIFNFKILLLLLASTLFLNIPSLSAQYTFGGGIDVCPTNLIIATCSGSETFSGTYSNNPTNNVVEGVQICSNDGSPVTVTFTANTVEAGFDVVSVLDGTNQYNFPVLGSGDETGFNDGQPAIGATYTSTNGCIYVALSDDDMNNLGITNGMIAFDIGCAGGGAGSGLFTEPVGPGTSGDGISAVNDDCANAYTLSNTYNVPVTLVANNYDSTSGPGDNTCDPDPSDVSGQSTLETTVYFEYCTGANPGLYQGYGFLNQENCIRTDTIGLGITALLTGTCGNFTPIFYNIGDQLPANTCFTFMIDGLSGDECQFQPYFNESPLPECGAIYDFVVDNFCSGDAAFFDLQAGCNVEVDPTTGQPYVDFDWYVYAPGGVPGEAPMAYDPLPATNDNFPITNPDLVLDGDEAACSDVAGSNTIINNTCDPIIVTYYMLPWDRQFDSDGDSMFGEYFVGANACLPLRFDVTIYPSAFISVETAGNCSQAMVEIQSVDGSVCPPENGEATSGATTTDLGCGVVDSQTLDYTFDYFTGTPCPQNIVGSVASSCFGACPPVDPDFDCPTPPKCDGAVPLNPITPGGVWSGSGAPYVNANNEFGPTNAPANTTLTLIYTVLDALGNPVTSTTCTFEVTTDCEANGGRF